MAGEWVDFKAVKEAVSMQAVLDHYGITGLSSSGDELRGTCPIHKGSPKKKTFTVNVRKNAFRCFSTDCKASGNVLDFVAKMENCSVRDAALKLADWFVIGKDGSPTAESTTNAADEIQKGIYQLSDGTLYEVIINAASAEDLEPLVVYREMFGDYRFWIAPIENFARSGESSTKPRFTLIKSL